VLLLLILLVAGGALAAGEIANRQFPVDLGDFVTTAELSYPTAAEGPLPTLLLIHDLGPMDRDASAFSFDFELREAKLLSNIFRDLAERVSSEGYAVIRYDKHYVTAGQVVDYPTYARLGMKQLLEDAARVLQAAESLPEVDPELIFLYGWGEGSTVAAALARRSEVAGLILQGPVVRPWFDTLETQMLEVGIPYLKSFAPDGRVEADTLREVLAGPGGVVAKSIVNYLADPALFEDGTLAVSPFLDIDSDGVITLEGEFLPRGLAQGLAFLLSPLGPMWRYGRGQALPVLEQQAKRLKMPMLILQGERDASTPADDAAALADRLLAAGNGDVTLRLYSTLGHSLGETPSLTADNFQAIAEQPLKDLLEWLRLHRGGEAGSQ